MGEGQPRVHGSGRDGVGAQLIDPAKTETDPDGKLKWGRKRFSPLHWSRGIRERERSGSTPLDQRELRAVAHVPAFFVYALVSVDAGNLPFGFGAVGRATHGSPLQFALAVCDGRLIIRSYATRCGGVAEITFGPIGGGACPARLRHRRGFRPPSRHPCRSRRNSRGARSPPRTVGRYRRPRSQT